MTTRDLSNDVVLVAGSSGALGSLISREIHAHGARVVLCGRDQDRLSALSNELGGTVQSRLDFLEPRTVTESVEVALSSFGRIDGVVNAAGCVAFGPLSSITREVLTELLVVDLIGPLDLIAQAVPHMDSGFVVNISGVVAEQALGNMVPYCAAKAGLSHASTGLKRELRRQKVTVLDARPPHTETGLAGRSINGTAPKMGAGLDPTRVAERIVRAVLAGESEITSASFAEA